MGGTNGVDALELAPEDAAVGGGDAEVFVQQRGEVVPGLSLRRRLFHAVTRICALCRIRDFEVWKERFGRDGAWVVNNR